MSLFTVFVIFSFPIRNISAQSYIDVLKNSAHAAFPEQIDFRLSVRLPSTIKQISLLYGANRRTCLDQTARQVLKFEHGKQVEVQWTWDFKKQGALPPGTEIWWQWEIVDEQGNKHLTEQRTLLFGDTRFAWKHLETTSLTLFWSEGDQQFGRFLLKLAGTSLKDLENGEGISPIEKVNLYIYPTTDDVREAALRGPDWIGGIAYPDANSILIGIAPGDEVWAAEVIPHELAHLVSSSLTFNCLGNHMPTWLDEGLSVYAEVAESRSMDQLDNALKNNRLPALRSMSDGFAKDPMLANIEYTASGQVVQYLIETYGKEALRNLLQSIQDGESIDPALQAAYGINTDLLDRAWRSALGYGSSMPPTTAVPSGAYPTNVPTLAIWTPAFGNATSTLTPVSTHTRQVESSPTTTPEPVALIVPTATTAGITPEDSKQPLAADLPSPGWLPVLGFGGLIFAAGVALLLIRRARS